LARGTGAVAMNIALMMIVPTVVVLALDVDLGALAAWLRRRWQ
jgi:hypothetical protein